MSLLAQYHVSIIDPTSATTQTSEPPILAVPSPRPVVTAARSPVMAPPIANAVAPPKKRAKLVQAVTDQQPLLAPSIAMPVASAPVSEPCLPPPPLLEQLSNELGDSGGAMLDLPEEALRLAAAAAAAEAKAEAKREEDKQRRLYRVGLSYRCGRCGKPKKGHVCDMPEPDEAGGSSEAMASMSPQPAILATTIRKGTPPNLLGSPLLANAGGFASAGTPVAHASSPLVQTASSPLADVKVSGEATTIFKDMVAALGENGMLAASPTDVVSPGAPPPQIVSTGISPLAVSAIAAGSVSNASGAAPGAVPLATPVPTGAEPQLSEMDLMLADLAFAARPPPVMTPDEGAEVCTHARTQRRGLNL